MIESSGLRDRYEQILAKYKAQYQVDRFLWEETYTFDKIEHNLDLFESSLSQPESTEEEAVEDIEEEQISPQSPSASPFLLSLWISPYLWSCVQEDDGRDVEDFGAPPEIVEAASNYFLRQIYNGNVVNSFKNEKNDSHVVLRIKDVLLTLNEINSRCFREIIKWKEEVINPE